jgi:hypothetical protein
MLVECKRMEALAISDRELRNERDIFEAQQRVADDEKSRRAREQLEAARREAIQAQRRLDGCCVLCGRRMSRLARLNADRHRTCREFQDDDQ